MEPSSIVIGPMGVGEVLDGGFTLAKRNYRVLAGIAAWGAAPSYLAIGLAGAVGSSSRPGLVALSVILTILAVVGIALSGVATAIACARLIEPEQAWAIDDQRRALDPAAIYARALTRLGPLVLYGLAWIVLAIPLLILLPLGIFVLGRWAISYVVISIEPVGPIDSLRRSWQLTRGSWWHTATVTGAGVLITSIVTFVLAGVIGGVGTLLGMIIGNEMLTAVSMMLANAIPVIAVQPFSAAMLVVLYYELRARSEGYDLAQRVAQLSATA